MLNITELLCFLAKQATPQTREPGSQLEFPLPETSLAPIVVVNPPPMVTWRMTRSCNLNCLNCLSDARPRHYGGELSTAEGFGLISDLAALRVPRLLFAGGEPLLRSDLAELVAYTCEWEIQPFLLTNGTLLSRERVRELRSAGLHTVVIWLEGIGQEVDRHRGQRGAFQAILEGYENCEAAGLAVEIRTPLSCWNYPELPDILDLVEHLRVRRVVFAHLIYAGRGNNPQEDMSPEEKRRALDLIIERAEDFLRRGIETRIATDENHVDGIYLYLQLARKDRLRAAAAFWLLQACGACVQGSGVGQAGIGPTGDVYPDPYWTNYILGNVRTTHFHEIWEKSTDSLLQALRDRLPLLKGRCANCRWKQACGGSLRVRAEETGGDPWVSDPACYLTDQEISKEVKERVEAMEDDVLFVKKAA